MKKGETSLGGWVWDKRRVGRGRIAIISHQ